MSDFYMHTISRTNTEMCGGEKKEGIFSKKRRNFSKKESSLVLPSKIHLKWPLQQLKLFKMLVKSFCLVATWKNTPMVKISHACTKNWEVKGQTVFPTKQMCHYSSIFFTVAKDITEWHMNLAWQRCVLKLSKFQQFINVSKVTESFTTWWMAMAFMCHVTCQQTRVSSSFSIGTRVVM